MMAAITAAETGAAVLLIEREEKLMRKLRITGKGRCNITNHCDNDTVMKNVVRNGRFLYSALSGFSTDDAMEFFEKLGVHLKIERGNRVFPVSDRAEDVVNALRMEAIRVGVEFLYARAEEICAADGRVITVKADDYAVHCDAAILCTGGLSYPKTGSTGDGYRMAQQLGHTVTELRPSLVSLCSEDEDCAEMQGLSLRNVAVSLVEDGTKTVRTELGEMQFTHFGVTGPLILSASSHMKPGKRYSLRIDLKPGLDEKTLDARLLRDFSENLNREFRNSLSGLLPRLMIPVVVRRSGIPPETRVNAITREQRANLLKELKRFEISVSGTRPIDEAVITSGGIHIKEIYPATMMSKLVNGLFFAGEIMDVDAYTGGFNLQIAWCTGKAAGASAAAYSMERKEDHVNTERGD